MSMVATAPTKKFHKTPERVPCRPATDEVLYVIKREDGMYANGRRGWESKQKNAYTFHNYVSPNGILHDARVWVENHMASLIANDHATGLRIVRLIRRA